MEPWTFGFRATLDGTGLAHDGAGIIDLRSMIAPTRALSSPQHRDLPSHPHRLIAEDLPAMGAARAADGGPLADEISGTPFDDTLTGTDGADTLSGLGGADTLNGGAGDDVIFGYAADAPGVITATPVITGLAAPVAAAAAPSDPGFLYIVEKDTGVIWRCNVATGQRTQFLDIPDNQFTRDGERGALGIAFHPEYAANGRFFVFVTDDQGDLQVREYHRSADPIVAETTFTVILEIPHSTFSNHNGGWIGFSPVDGYLYISTGDGGGSGDPSNNAQNINVLLGKILRIDVDGGDAFPLDPTRNYAIPADNPFVGIAGADEIYAYGLRNPWRAAFDPRNGDFYIGDVGQGAREEIDYIAAGDGGLNFGWRIMEGNIPFNPAPPPAPQPGDPSLIAPVFDYPRNVGTTVTGGEVYVGANAAFVGQYVFADFGSHRLFSLSVVDGDGVHPTDRTAQITGATLSLVVDFATDSNGALYAIGIGGTVWRLDPGPGAEDVGDTLNGGAGNDAIHGGAGNDALNGGAGIDAAVYPTASTSATWVRNLDGSWTVTAGVSGADTMLGVEFLDFTDRDVFLDRAARTFAGDGASDILWRNTAGLTVIWSLNGENVTGSGSTSAQVGLAWSISDTGDFDGDGRDDILWRNTNGQTVIWHMNGGTVSQAGATSAQVDNGWSIEGVGDFNLDGRDDILWRNASGHTVIWHMNGTSVAQAGATSAQVGNQWQIAGIGDFNGDGRDDFVWRHDSGVTTIWHMNGTAVASSGATSISAGLNWTIAGVGDFNADGRDDLLWRSTTGATVIWHMNGTTAQSAPTSIQVGNEWSIAAVGDYNADGRDDILWRHDNGVTVLWEMQGVNVIDASATSSQAGADWGIV